MLFTLADIQGSKWKRSNGDKSILVYYDKQEGDQHQVERLQSWRTKRKVDLWDDGRLRMMTEQMSMLS